MDTPQLEAFLEIVEVGSFTRAAAHLGVAQPSITNRIKALERVLGVPLLERLPQGVRPTEAGWALVPYAREIVGLTSRAREAVRAHGEPHGLLNVGSVESLTSHRLLPLIEHIYMRYPMIEVSVQSVDSSDAISRVRDGRLDCAFFIDCPRTEDDLVTETLCVEPLALVVGAGHPLAERDTVTVNDLQQTTLVRSENHQTYHSLFVDALGHPPHRQGRRGLNLGSIDAAKRSVANGIGMALLPAVALEPELSAGTLHRLAWDPPFDTYTQVTWRRNRTHHPAIVAVVSAAGKVIQEQLTVD
ncbi:LysR family transcriptional regulator [Actinoplanes sp. NPDC020271]|uniref:LysR family transcriptional regulator n=1 Tax=Actinoplanes sp. NPDC020271 TaxID=3363896 RepID=UPI0037896927